MRDNMDWYRKSKHVSKLSEIPEGENWVALEERSVTIPGDERSKTNPGHGYPESVTHFLDIIVFDDKEAMESWIKYQDKQYSKSSYKVVCIRTLQVKKTTTVEII
jgi:hypothetical protein